MERFMLVLGACNQRRHYVRTARSARWAWLMEQRRAEVALWVAFIAHVRFGS